MVRQRASSLLGRILPSVLFTVLILPTVQIETAHASERDFNISVEGLVDQPYILSYRDLLEMPAITVYAKLYCVGVQSRPGNLDPKNKLGFPLYCGFWKGVPLKTILERAGVKPCAMKTAIYGADGFTSDLLLEDAFRPEVIVAYQLNNEPIEKGEALPPNRLVVPAQWGYKWVEGIVKIEAVDYDFRGVYEAGGFPERAFTEGQNSTAAYVIASSAHSISEDRGLLTDAVHVSPHLLLLSVIAPAMGIALGVYLKRRRRAGL